MQAALHALAIYLGWFFMAVQILLFLQWVFWLVGADPFNPIVRFVHRILDPPLAWLRGRLPFLVQGAWDLTPLAMVLICIFLNKAAADALRRLAGIL